MKFFKNSSSSFEFFVSRQVPLEQAQHTLLQNHLLLTLNTREVLLKRQKLDEVVRGEGVKEEKRRARLATYDKVFRKTRSRHNTGVLERNLLLN
jgi:hypothetical protein